MTKEKKEKVVTQQVSLRLTVEAVDLLARLAPSENKRGRYMSELILRAAQERGFIETREPTVEDQLAALKQQLADLEAKVQKQEG